MRKLICFCLLVVAAGWSAAVGLASPPLPGPWPSSPQEAVTLSLEPTPAPSPPPLPNLPEKVTLADVLAVALANNPQTRASWTAAKAAAAELGRKHAAYYPTVDASFSFTRLSQWAVGGRFGFQQTTYGPALSLTYLLLDLGGRSARVEEAFQALLAADFAHNATVQEVTYQVTKAYFSYLTTQALCEAAKAGVEDARKHVEAAEARKEVGLATILDVLQARTALAQAHLQQASLEGQVEAVRGALVTAMGFPPTAAIQVTATLPQLPELRQVEKVEDLVAHALLARPEVQRARALERQAQAKYQASKAEGLPSLVFSASAARSYYQPAEARRYGDNWSLSLALRLPLFTGFERSFSVQQAQAQAEQAQAAREVIEQQASLEVWNAYYQVATARAKLAAASELLAAAEQTQQVAEGRYQQGVGSMLDVTQAQSVLAQARAEEVRARADYLLALTALARACGSLTPPSRLGQKGAWPW